MVSSAGAVSLASLAGHEHNRPVGCLVRIVAGEGIVVGVIVRAVYWLAVCRLLLPLQTAGPAAGPPSGQDLVDLVRRDPVAMDLIRQDDALKEEINRRPTLRQVMRELHDDPRVFLHRVRKTLTNPWVLFGFGAQAMFLMRFVIQWIASEKRKRSYVPVSFWWFSLAGGVTLFVYAVSRFDPVFALGQGLGCVIYLRNLVLIHRRSAEYRCRRTARSGGNGSGSDFEPPDS